MTFIKGAKGKSRREEVFKIKKIIALLPAIFVLLAPVFAQTSVNIQWSGSGFFNTHFNAGDDATAYFETNGNSINGQFQATNYEDNPYHYNVNTVDAKIKADVKNGYMGFVFTRTDSYEPMYGPAGQQSYTYIEADDGTFAWHSRSNFASLRNCNYGWQNSNQITADGNFYIEHELVASDEKYAYIVEKGNGNTKISDMSEEAGKGYTFGKGCGCYTNAKVESTGSGEFTLYATAPNKIQTDSGITVNGGDLTIASNYNNGFTFNDFALSGS